MNIWSKAANILTAKTGKITIPKGTRKGTYKLKVRVNASGDDTHDPGSRTVTCVIVVK